MSELTTLSALLDDARKRKDNLDTAVAAFRALPFEEQLRFLVTVEDEVVIASGAAGAVLSLGAANRPALPPAPDVVERDLKPDNAPSEPAPFELKQREEPFRKPRQRYGPEMAAEVCKHFDEGRSQGQIAELMNISYPTVNKMLRAAGRNTSGNRGGRPPKSGTSDPEGSHSRPRPIIQHPNPQSPRHPSPIQNRSPIPSPYRSPNTGLNRSQSPDRSASLEPVPRERPPNPRRLLAEPSRLLSANEELGLARQLEDLEIAAWTRVLEHPGIVANLDVTHQVSDLTKARTGVAEVTVINPATLRRQDPNRRALDVIVEIVRRDETIDRDIRGELVGLADGAHVIRHRFVACNVRLVGKISQKYLWTKIAHEDLMQEGLMGLMHSIGIYDYRRNLRFSTYATWWIKHFMLRAWENSAEVRIPVHIHTSQSKIATTVKRLTKELGRAPTEPEIAAGAGMTLKQFHAATGPGWWIIAGGTSFDAEVSDDGTATFGDYFVDPNSEDTTALHDLITAESTELVTAAVEQLGDRDADVIRRRFGIGCEPETLETIGIAYDLSRERVRQLEQAAIEELRGVIARIRPGSARRVAESPFADLRVDSPP